MTASRQTGHVTVLGAGVIGVTSAYLLARDGHTVTVIERESGPGQGGSAENGAQLSYGFADPISGPATLRRMPAIVTGQDPGISVHARHLLANPVWSLAFMRNCLGDRCRQNTAALTRLALHSRAVMAQIRAETAIDFEFTRAGRLVLYSNRRAFEASGRGVAFRNGLGCDLALLSRDECLALDGALSQWSEPIAGGVYSSSDEVGDAGAWCRALAQYCAENLDVDFRFSCRVEGFTKKAGAVTALRTDQGDIAVERLVVCLGPQSNVLKSWLDLKLPIVPLKGYSLTIPAISGSPNVSIASAEHRIVFARLGGTVRFAGLAHLRGMDLELDQAHVDEVSEGARRLLPGAGNFDAPISSWCGLRPLTPDGLPCIGATRLRNVFLNTGHGGLGWTLAAGSAALLAAIMDDASVRQFRRGSDISFLGNAIRSAGVTIA